MTKVENVPVAVASDSGFEARREEIRRGATRVFASRGYASATMRDVADEIGILAGSLYHYFPSKEDLLVEGMQCFYDDSVRELKGVINSGGDPVETLKATIALAVQFLVERTDEATIILNDFDYLRVIPAFDFIGAGAGAVEKLWVEVLTAGARSGAFRTDVDPVIVYRTIMGSIFAAARWYNPDGPMKVDRFIAQLTTTFLDGLIVRSRPAKERRGARSAKGPRTAKRAAEAERSSDVSSRPFR
jgi:AcrR family transcriptional regulator